MATKYSKNLCSDIKAIAVNKKKSDFEKCDEIFTLLKGGFFGKELVDKYPDEYHTIKNILTERKIANSQWLSIRCLDRFVRLGILHTITDNHLKTTLGIMSLGLAKELQAEIRLKNNSRFQAFLTKVQQKFGENTFDYSQGVFHNEDTPMLMICQKCETQFLQTPNRHLTSKFPCFQCVLYTNGFVANDEKTDHWSRVLPGLYIGNIHAANDQAFMLNKRINGIIDLANAPQQVKFSRSIRVYKINIDDNATANIKPWLKHTYNFIEEHMDKNQSVLIFCRAGVSRSATIIIHYLMRRYNISYYDAYRFLKAKRPHVQPNEGFVRQLQDVEDELFGETSSAVQEPDPGSDGNYAN